MQDEVLVGALRGEIEEVLPGAPMELHAGIFEPILRRDAVHGVGGVGVEEDRQMRPEPTDRPPCDAGHLVEVQRSARPLVGDHRIDIPVGDDHFPARQRGSNEFVYVLRLVGGVGERFRPGIDVARRRVEQQASERSAQLRTPGLARHHPIYIEPRQVGRKVFDLGGFADAVAALKCNEEPCHRNFFRIFFSAFLPFATCSGQVSIKV